jgi:hypothetical protein
MGTVVTVGAAVLFAAMGLVALVRPAYVVGVFGGTAATVDARNEVRAVYGGFGIAIAMLLLGAPPEMREGVVVAVAIALAGMAGGRVVAFVVERPRHLYPTVLLCVVEAVLAVALLLVR